LSIAKGQWIVFWDSDDTPYPKTFFQMIEQATIKELDFAVGNWVESTNPKFEPIALQIATHDNSLRDLIRYPGIWRWAFKRSAIGDTRFPHIHLGEDLVFLSKLQIRLSRVYRYREVVYSYSTGDESQLTSKNSVRRNSVALFRYVKSRNFFSGKVTFFGALLKAKLLASTIKRVVFP
jgi:glycosyltransferase involved in cell wall biosynthesis